MHGYQNSECEEHRNIKTSAPVCIICLVEEIARLRKLAKACLDARDKEAKAAMSFENAQMNFSSFDAEDRAHDTAMNEASKADSALRKALEMPNDRVEGRDAASSRHVPSHDGLAGSGPTE